MRGVKPVELVQIEELEQGSRIELDRGRTDEKREKDKQRMRRRDEIAKVFKEAYRDNVDSLGEVDVDKNHNYPALNIAAGDVLKDPKLRFGHPFLKGGVMNECRSISRRDRLREFGDEHGWGKSRRGKSP
jgi:hypothetical protein